MEHYKNYFLTEYTTFRVPARTKNYFRFDDAKELKQWLLSQSCHYPEIMVLGGGSNILFTKDYEGAILHPVFKGIEIIEENKDSILIRFAAGEEWDHCVAWCVNQGFYGIENLSYIPGSAGAAAVQNIGAYGVELSEVLEWVEGYYLENGEKFKLSNQACQYDYRYSIFKGPLKNKTVITHVVLRLMKSPQWRLSYGQVREAIQALGEINLKNVRKAITDIRKSKLPDPALLGNGGSFFKNPIVEIIVYEKLKEQYPDAVGFPLSNNHIKLSAGWLIEKAGWKGRSMGKAGVHDKQALVLVNKGVSSGKEIADLAEKIRNDVFNKFGVHLEPEVNIL